MGLAIKTANTKAREPEEVGNGAVFAGPQLRGAESGREQISEGANGKRMAGLGTTELQTRGQTATKCRTDGHAERRKGRRVFRFAHEPLAEHGPSIGIGEILGKIENSKLAEQLGMKVWSDLFTGLFAELDPESFSMDPKKRAAAREGVIRTLNENAEAIWPRLWLINRPSVEFIIGSITAGQRLESLFVSKGEFVRAVDIVTCKTKVPGLLLLEAVQDKLETIRERGGGALLRSDGLLSQKIPIVDGEGESAMVALGSHLEQLGANINMRITERARDREAKGRTGLGRIIDRINRFPDQFLLRREISAMTLRYVGDVLGFCNGKHCWFTSPIVIFSGGLRIAKAPDGKLCAVAEGKRIRLVALSSEEERFLRPRYEEEVETREHVGRKQ
jgi:hypothetical protein